jgi:DNA polymerase-3 subunit epsilon
MAVDRILVYDTETTGIAIRDGHRVIEVAFVEIINRVITGRTYRAYVNPQRLIEPEAMRIHKITDEMVSRAPLFKEILPELLDVLHARGNHDAKNLADHLDRHPDIKARIGIDFRTTQLPDKCAVAAHNAQFDEEHLNNEMMIANHPNTWWEEVGKPMDTIKLSRSIYSTGRHSLDALLDRLNIDRSIREVEGHGALLDCQLLAQAYLQMTEGLDLSGPTLEDDKARPEIVRLNRASLGRLVVTAPATDEEQAHIAYLDALEEESHVVPVARRGMSP